VEASETLQTEALGMPLATLLAERPPAEARAVEGLAAVEPRPGQPIPALRRGS
jgi:hypothetical protein